MTDKLTQTGSQASQELSRSLCQEQIMIDGVDVGGCKYLNTFSDCDGYHYYCDLADDIKNEYCEYYKDCCFKQLARKTQLSIEQSKELIRLRQELKESTVKNKNLKQECEELKKQLETSEEWRIKAESLNEKLELRNTCYRKALEEIKEIVSSTLDCGEWVGQGDNKMAKILDIISRAKDC